MSIAQVREAASPFIAPSGLHVRRNTKSPENSGAVRGVDHRQAKRCRAMIRVSLFEAMRMQDSDYSRKHDLECLRFASDLSQMASSRVSPGLRSQFLRMAKVWTDLAGSGPNAHSRKRP